MDDRSRKKSDFQPYTDSNGADHLGPGGPGPNERLAAALSRLGRFEDGQRFRVRGTPYDHLATSLARHRYWQSEGLTFDQAADTVYFEGGGRGPWQGWRMTQVWLRKAASDLASSSHRAGLVPLDCLVYYPIEVRR
jgi:hypothetical protein